MIKDIEQFLKQPAVSPIFIRPYSLGNILALYDAYQYKFKEITGEEVANVLIHYRGGQFEFIVDFADYTPRIVKRINSKKKYTFLHDGIDSYYQRVKQFKLRASDTLPVEKRKKIEVFNEVSKIYAFEAFTFIIHFIDKDLKIPIKDAALLDKCEKARIDTENFFTPGGEIDSYLGKLDYVPGYVRNYEPSYKGEFIIFNNQFVYNKKIIQKYSKLKKERFEKNLSGIKEIKGTTTFAGKAQGRAKVILSKRDFSKVKKDNILVAHGTTTDYMPVIRMASAIISDEGGFLCHAAIISRELKIPCIVGTRIATKVIKDNDVIEVDANHGIIKIIKITK